METTYPHLFSPLRVGDTIFRNRIFTAPTHHCLQGDEKAPNEAAMAYYAAKARGGAAVITVGGIDILPEHSMDDIHVDYDIYDPIHRRYFAQLTDTIHFYGAKASLELNYVGDKEFAGPWAEGRTLYGPVERIRPDGVAVHEMPEWYMQELADQFADCAMQAKLCGFDMILIHAGHGMGLSLFLSPRTNTRTDRYGGSLENRARFPIMVLDRIRERVGRDLLIEYRISGDERTEGGMKIDEVIDYLEMIQDRIDLAHISAGDLNDIHTRAITHPSCFLPPAANAYLAKAVKQSGRIHIPVVTVGAIYDPELAEGILASGEADVVTTARGIIADPDLPNKAKHGQSGQIVPCIKCFRCLDGFKKTGLFVCSVNPAIGRQHKLKLLVDRPGRRKKAVVIGGGPAGMQAALTAAARGHQVVLFEEKDHLGGQLGHVEGVSFKYDLKKYLDHLVRQVEQVGVEVRLNTRATPEAVAAERADVVLPALGAAPITPPIPGADSDFVLQAEWCFEHTDELGPRVVVVGGGQVGCELALHLTERGSQVTVVEQQAVLAPDAVNTHRIALLDRLNAEVSCLTETRCVSIAPGRVTVSAADGAERVLAANHVVLAVGMRSRIDEVEPFLGTALDVIPVGDCVNRVKNVQTAVRTAFDAASLL